MGCYPNSIAAQVVNGLLAGGATVVATSPSSLDSSNMISQNASLRLPWLTQAFGGSRVNSGLFLAIIALIFVWLLMKKTTLGFEIRSVGLNPFASEAR